MFLFWHLLLKALNLPVKEKEKNVCFVRIFEVRCVQLLTFVLTFSIRFSLSGAAPLPGIRRSLPNVSSVLRLKNLYVGQI